jgi:hypothetical protein
MSEIPHAVLSEHFQERLEGRRLRSAVFLTYQFDPGFFEQEVLPVFMDIPLSHAASIRLVQLEDALRDLSGSVAVYYDSNGLVTGDAGSAKLDIRRIPVQHRTGIFHPKNVFLLVEDEDPDENGFHAQALFIASLSANLTRSGWWENVECCHVEEITEGDRSRLKEDVASFLDALRRKASAESDHATLRDILTFLRSVEQRQQKSSAGLLHTHFYAGRESLADFLDQTVGASLRGAYLEVVSPYFDDATECAPLATLVERFGPKEVRVFLPRSPAGEALVRQELYESVRAMPDVQWGRLPKEMLRLGRSEDASERSVHAKVYRFFTQNPKREICFVGSANLTSPAHHTGGNVETGFLVEMEPPRRPEFWMTPNQRRPAEFLVREEDDATAASGGTRLNLRYHWDQSRAEAYWDAPDTSPALRLAARGVDLGTIGPLPSRAWTEATPELSRRVGEILEETSLFEVYGEGDKPGLLLVQEEGMSHKPSLLFRLSAADILRYWSLLTPEQRAAFLEARAPELALTGQGADLVTRAKAVLDHDTVFDRFAGFFHAFGCLERAVRSALDESQEKEANYRLFGKKYDSLGSLLDRVSSEQSNLDAVDRYVISLCARQLCLEIARTHPDYWGAHSADVKSLEARFAELTEIRKQLAETHGAGFSEFMDWFDRWFLRRAEPVEVEP